MTLELDLVDPCHADVAQHLEVLQVRLAKRHPEPNALEALQVLRERLELLVIEEEALLLADARIVEDARHAQRVGLLPLAVLPVAAARGDLANVDLGIEIRRERFAVRAGVAVDDVDRVDP